MSTVHAMVMSLSSSEQQTSSQQMQYRRCRPFLMDSSDSASSADENTTTTTTTIDQQEEEEAVLTADAATNASIPNNPTTTKNATTTGADHDDVRPKKRKTRTNKIAQPLVGFYDSLCEEDCPPLSRTANNNDSCNNSSDNNNNDNDDIVETTISHNKNYIVVFLTNPQWLEKMLILIAGLLCSGEFRVRVITGPFLPDHQRIKQVLFRYIPCQQQYLASTLFTFQNLMMDPTRKDELVCSTKNNRQHTQQPVSSSSTVFMSAGDVLLCGLQVAPLMIDSLLEQVVRNDEAIQLISVMVMDVTYVAGILVAEKFRIPTILMAEHAHDMLSHVVGGPTSRRLPQPNKDANSTAGAAAASSSGSSGSPWWWWLNPTSWVHMVRGWYFTFIHSYIEDRILTPLDLTKSFVALNRIRHQQLGLHRVRRISDLWKHSILFWKIQNTDEDTTTLDYTTALGSRTRTRRIMPLHVASIPGTVLPPCIQCIRVDKDDDDDSDEDTNVTTSSTCHELQDTDSVENKYDDDVAKIVVTVGFRNDNTGRPASRRFLQALALVRATLKEWKNRDCSKSNSKQRKYCWRGPSDITVVRPGPIPEEHLPAYVQDEQTSFLDTLARHQPDWLVSVCDNSNVWVQSLNIPIVCIKTEWGARRTAVRLLRRLKSYYDDDDDDKNSNNNEEPLSLSSTTTMASSKPSQKGNQSEKLLESDGLAWMVQIIEKAGLLKDHWGYANWKSGEQMGQELHSHLKRDLLEFEDGGASQHDENDADGFYHSVLGSLIVLLAWTILGLTTLYLFLKDTAAFQQFRYRPLHQYHHHRNSHYQNAKLMFCMILEEICIRRLTDFDQLGKLWTKWVEEELARWNLGPVSNRKQQQSGTAGTAVSSEGEHPHGHSRRGRRHTSKKKH